MSNPASEGNVFSNLFMPIEKNDFFDGKKNRKDNDLMYNEVPIVGNEYSKGDWKKIAIHDETSVKGFFGDDYRFLSNFYDSPVYYDGLLYRSSECAYQAAKLLPHYRPSLQSVSSSVSKRMWKSFGEDSLYDNCAEEWDERKYDVMSVIVFDKFYRNKILRKKLLDTGCKYLEETNWWNDQVYGVDIKNGGKNWLGTILMKTREYWK
jgi:ribA/ribD-fused uncharacterized protein